VLGLGNDILADDAVGVIVARAVRRAIDHQVDVVEASLHGVALLDLLTGYDRAIIVDSIRTGSHPPGAVMVIDPAKLAPVYAPSPHYAGLPEVLALAGELELPFPSVMDIVAVEVEDTVTIGGAMTPAVRAAVPEACRQVVSLLSTEPVRPASAAR
jgi:hydrogenase maturation protease